MKLLTTMAEGMETGLLEWTPMEVAYVGHVGDVLQAGTGKLSPCNGDPGEARKPKGQEPPPSHPESNNPGQHPPPCG